MQLQPNLHIRSILDGQIKYQTLFRRKVTVLPKAFALQTGELGFYIHAGFLLFRLTLAALALAILTLLCFPLVLTRTPLALLPRFWRTIITAIVDTSADIALNKVGIAVSGVQHNCIKLAP